MNPFAALFGAPAAPAPSLCDACQHAYNMPGGSVCVGGVSYEQRYCGKLTIAIHTDGKQACEYYMTTTLQTQ